MATRTNLFTVLALGALALIVSAPATARADLRQCFIDCRTHIEGLETDETLSDEAILERCVTGVPSCTALDDASSLTQIESLCDTLAARRRGAVSAASTGTEPTPAFCIMPDGTGVSDLDGLRCCPSGLLPLRVSRSLSADRLASFHIPRGHSVYMCGNALAAPGAPGSRDERFDALASRVSDLEAGWRALCAPDEGESMEAACTDARTEFLAAGSGTGPVDLSEVEAAIASLRNADTALHEELESLRQHTDSDILGVHAAIRQLAESHSILLQCLTAENPDFMVSWTGPGPDGNDITTEMPCPDILRAASEEAIEAARAEAGRVAREEVGRIAGSALRGDHAFFGASLFAFVNFNPLVHANTNYGNLGVVGLELTFGTTFSGTWNWQIGLDVGYGFPDLEGATNLEGMLRLGLGTWVDPRFQIGFGLIGAVRFQPDITAVHAIYGAYLDGTYRFSATDTVTPFLTLRVMAGASPRQPADVWRIDGDGAAMFLFGVLIN